jgi:hypothetical protein
MVICTELILQGAPARLESNSPGTFVLLLAQFTLAHPEVGLPELSQLFPVH